MENDKKTITISMKLWKTLHIKRVNEGHDTLEDVIWSFIKKK